MAGKEGALNKLFDTMRDAASEGDVPVGKIVQTVGSRGNGPLLAVPALAALSPIAAIPGVPTLLAALIVFFAAQILIGEQGIWLPRFLRQKTVDADRMKKSVGKLRPAADILDRFLARRVTWAAGETATTVAAVVVVLLCLSVPPLELLPGAVVAPMLAVALIGLAMMVRDGIAMLLGFAAALVALGTGLWFLL